MSTLFYAIPKHVLISSGCQGSENPCEILLEKGCLIGQSIYGSRFLFGPKFSDGLISFSSLIEKDNSIVIIDEYMKEISPNKMIELISSTFQFENHPQNVLHFIPTSDGFLFSPNNFS